MGDRQSHPYTRRQNGGVCTHVCLVHRPGKGGTGGTICKYQSARVILNDERLPPHAPLRQRWKRMAKNSTSATWAVFLACTPAEADMLRLLPWGVPVTAAPEEAEALRALLAPGGRPGSGSPLTFSTAPCRVRQSTLLLPRETPNGLGGTGRDSTMPHIKVLKSLLFVVVVVVVVVVVQTGSSRKGRQEHEHDTNTGERGRDLADRRLGSIGSHCGRGPSGVVMFELPASSRTSDTYHDSNAATLEMEERSAFITPLRR